MCMEAGLSKLRDQYEMNAKVRQLFGKAETISSLKHTKEHLSRMESDLKKKDKEALISPASRTT
jgi:hypothetical protein